MMNVRFVKMMFYSMMFVLAACGGSKMEKTHKLLMSAREKIYLHDLNGAWEDLEKCQKVDKNHQEVYFLKGNILMTWSRYEEAMEMYNKAIELDENYMEAYVNRGRLWFYLGDSDKQCEDYLKAESLGATNLYEETKFCR